MSDYDEPTDEELEEWDKQYQEHMEMEYERMIRDIATMYSNKAKEFTNECIEKTNEEKFYEIEYGFKCWEYTLNRLEGLFISSYTDFNTLIDVNSEIYDIIYSSISLALSGHYKSALTLIRQWLELHITALFYDKLINSRDKDSPSYKKLLNQKRSWLIGKGKKITFSGNNGMIDQFFDFDLEDKATIISKKLRLDWYNKNKTIKDLIKEIWRKLSTTTHFGIIKSKEKIGDLKGIIPFDYNEEYFQIWYKYFKQVYEITNVILFAYYPKILNLDDKTWDKCFFHFDKNLIKKYASSPNLGKS